MNVLLHQLQHFEHLADLVIVVLHLTAEVQRESEWEVIANLLAILLTPLLQVVIKLVLVR